MEDRDSKAIVLGEIVQNKCEDFRYRETGKGYKMYISSERKSGKKDELPIFVPESFGRKYTEFAGRTVKVVGKPKLLWREGRKFDFVIIPKSITRARPGEENLNIVYLTGNTVGSPYSNGQEGKDITVTSFKVGDFWCKAFYKNAETIKELIRHSDSIRVNVRARVEKHCYKKATGDGNYVDKEIYELMVNKLEVLENE